MSRPPKLTRDERAKILAMERRRRRIMRLMCVLSTKLREIPSKKELAVQMRASYSSIRRVLYGDPYRTTHPEDGSNRAA
jgi:hypothetical protein